MNTKCVETNFKIIANSRVNIELLFILNKIRTIVQQGKKEDIVIHVDNSENMLTFNFTANDNQIDPVRLNNEFNIK